jgi:hypothetical protein
MGDGPGAPGFAVLPDRKGGAHFLAGRSVPGAETLLDSTCAVAR